ncbi:MAG: Bax inhibitor-1/YccA family protein [Pseudomonadota bacterium]|nr:Bax inhibitor-1/YccA family protein [Pseudomonadota bacterium]
MASRDFRTASVASLSAMETNKVLKNTYLLLSATLGFSAVMAVLSMSMVNANSAGSVYMMSLLASMVLGMFVLPRTANSGAGLGVIFLVTGLLGFGVGPVVGMYMSAVNGPQVVATALGGTAAIFLGLSAYAVSSKRDFSFMGGFAMVGLFAVVGAGIANIFLQIPLLSLGLSAVIILLMSALILAQTSAIVRGGETNYIIATYTLYLSFFNIFTSLLHILGVAGGDD